MKQCIVCDEPTRNGRSDFCQECFEVFTEKLEEYETVERAKQVDVESPSNKFF